MEPLTTHVSIPAMQHPEPSGSLACASVAVLLAVAARVAMA